MEAKKVVPRKGLKRKFRKILGYVIFGVSVFVLTVIELLEISGRFFARLFKSKRNAALFGAVILVLVLAVLLGRAWYNGIDNESSVQSVVTFSSPRPSEAVVNTAGLPKADTTPYILNIPSIDVDAYMQNVGQDQNDRIASPNNVRLAGWYVNSSKPGDVGLSVINGHSTQTSNNSVFARLDSLKKGDEFTVTFGNNKSRRFRVVTTKQINLADSSGAELERVADIKKQLNIYSTTPESTTDAQTLIIAEGI